MRGGVRGEMELTGLDRFQGFDGTRRVSLSLGPLEGGNEIRGWRGTSAEAGAAGKGRDGGEIRRVVTISNGATAATAPGLAGDLQTLQRMAIYAATRSPFSSALVALSAPQAGASGLCEIGYELGRWWARHGLRIRPRRSTRSRGLVLH